MMLLFPVFLALLQLTPGAVTVTPSKLLWSFFSCFWWMSKNTFYLLHFLYSAIYSHCLNIYLYYLRTVISRENFLQENDWKLYYMLGKWKITLIRSLQKSKNFQFRHQTNVIMTKPNLISACTLTKNGIYICNEITRW